MKNLIAKLKKLGVKKNRAAYNKAVDDFTETIQQEYHNSIGIPKVEKEFLMTVSNQVAERLKTVYAK